MMKLPPATMNKMGKGKQLGLAKKGLKSPSMPQTKKANPSTAARQKPAGAMPKMAKGGYVKGMACGGMTKKGKK